MVGAERASEIGKAWVDYEREWQASLKDVFQISLDLLRERGQLKRVGLFKMTLLRITSGLGKPYEASISAAGELDRTRRVVINFPGFLPFLVTRKIANDEEEKSGAREVYSGRTYRGIVLDQRQLTHNESVALNIAMKQLSASLLSSK